MSNLAELNVYSYNLTISSQWANLYLKIKEMDFKVDIYLNGCFYLTLQLYINYLGTKWHLWPAFIPELVIFEPINVN